MKKKILVLLVIAIGYNLNAQRLDPLRTLDFEAQDNWVASILDSMSVEEKIGQLFMIQAYSNLDKKHEDFITKMISKYHVGNLIFMQGTPRKQAALTNKYQDTANRQVMTSMYAVTVYNGGMKHPAHATYGLPGFHRRLGRYKKGLLAFKTQREQAAVYREGLGTTSHVTRIEYCFKGALAKMFEPGGLVDNLQQMNWPDHTQLLVGQNRNGISVTMVEAASK